MTSIKLKLKELLEELRIKPLTVEQAARQDLGYKLGENSIYRILKTDSPKQINLESLTAIIHTLRHLTGREVSISDLLEYVPEEHIKAS